MRDIRRRMIALLLAGTLGISTMTWGAEDSREQLLNLNVPSGSLSGEEMVPEPEETETEYLTDSNAPSPSDPDNVEQVFDEVAPEDTQTAPDDAIPVMEEDPDGTLTMEPETAQPEADMQPETETETELQAETSGSAVETETEAEVLLTAAQAQEEDLVLNAAWGDGDFRPLKLREALDAVQKALEAYYKDTSDMGTHLEVIVTRWGTVSNGINACWLALQMLGITEDPTMARLAEILSQIGNVQDTLKEMNGKLDEIQAQLANVQATIEEKDRQTRARDFLARYQTFNSTYVEKLENMRAEYKGYINQAMKAWMTQNHNEMIWLLYTTRDGQLELTDGTVVREGTGWKATSSRSGETIEEFIGIPAAFVPVITESEFNINTYQSVFEGRAADSFRAAADRDQLVTADPSFYEEWKNAGEARKQTLSSVYAEDLLNTVIYRVSCNAMEKQNNWVVSVMNAYRNLCAHVVEKNSGIDALINVQYMTNGFEGETKQKIEELCNKMTGILGYYGIFALTVAEQDRLIDAQQHSSLSNAMADTISYMGEKLAASLTGQDNYCYLTGGIVGFTEMNMRSDMDYYYNNKNSFRGFSPHPWTMLNQYFREAKLPDLVSDKWMIVLYHSFLQQKKEKDTFTEYLRRNGVSVPAGFDDYLTSTYKGVKSFSLSDGLSMDAYKPAMYYGPYVKSPATVNRGLDIKDKYFVVHEKVEHNCIDPASGQFFTNRILCARAVYQENHWYWGPDKVQYFYKTGVKNMPKDSNHGIRFNTIENSREIGLLDYYSSITVPMYVLTLSRLPEFGASGEMSQEGGSVKPLAEISPLLAFGNASFMQPDTEETSGQPQANADWKSYDADTLDSYAMYDTAIDEGIDNEIRNAIARAKKKGIRAALTKKQRNQLRKKMKRMIFGLQDEIDACEPAGALDALGIGQNDQALMTLAKAVLSVWNPQMAADDEMDAANYNTTVTYEAGVILDFVKKNGRVQAELLPALEAEPTLLVWDPDIEDALYYPISDEVMAAQNLRMQAKVPAAFMKGQKTLILIHYDSFENPHLVRKMELPVEQEGQDYYVKTETDGKTVFALKPGASAGASMNSGFLVTWKGSKVKVRWGGMPEADTYEIYAAYCGTGGCRKVKTVHGVTKATIKKLNGAGLNPERNIKLYVVAYSNGAVIGRTIVAHAAGGENSHTNAKKILVSKDSFRLRVGESAQIKAETVRQDENRELLNKGHGARYRYESSNRSVATVNKEGRIRAVGTGSCDIRVFAQNGRSKKVTVTVL